MNPARDLQLLYEIGTMRLSTRTWKKFLNAMAQNTAEHTLRVIWIALTLAKYEHCPNTEKIIKMALIHDVSESRSEDVNYLSRQYVERREHDAIADTLKDTAWEPEMLALWEEAEARQTLEAKIIKDADNLDCDLELKELEAIGNTLPNALRAVRKQVGTTKLFTKSAQKFWKLIQTSDPHDWHVQGKNRLNTGDWKKGGKK